METLQQRIIPLRADYVDETALRVPSYQLYRYDDGNARLYYTYDLGEDVQFFPGVTGILEAVLPTPYSLLQWYVAKGMDQAIAYRNERAAYGSLMHTLFGQLLRDRAMDLDKVSEAVQTYFLTNNYTYSVIAWTEELKKDLLAFAQWVQEYQVTPLAIELPLCSQCYQVASLVDLVCQLELEEKGYWGETYQSGPRKGEPKETKRRNMRYAIVDFKSGKNGHTSSLSHELQLLFYEELVKENFPEFTETEFLLFNWHPKDWQTAPGCHLVNQTQKHELRELAIYSELYHLQNDLSQKTTILTHGVITLHDGDLSANYARQTYAEVIGKGGNGV